MLVFGYIALSLFVAISFVAVGIYALNRVELEAAVRKRKIRNLILFMVLWQTYIYIIGSSGFLMDFSFPPRFVLFLVLPALTMVGVFFYKNRKRAWIHVIPPSWLVYFQAFRIVVESLFVASIAAGILHKEVTIEGYNYDMLVGISAPFIGFIVFTKKWVSTKVGIAWNYLGLAVLASVVALFVTTTFFPQLYGASEAMLPLKAATYPFMLVPGFLMPVAVFLHILSIVQLTKSRSD